jgi:hypothetical protein
MQGMKGTEKHGVLSDSHTRIIVTMAIVSRMLGTCGILLSVMFNFSLQFEWITVYTDI